MGEAWPLEERLSSIAADLLSESERRLEPFAHRRFVVDPGTRQALADCCSGLASLPDFAADVFAGHADSFVVAHLPMPGSPSTAPYSLVLFVHTEGLWSTIAVYNGAELEEA